MRFQVLFSTDTEPFWSTWPAVGDKTRTVNRYFPPLGKTHIKTSSILDIQTLNSYLLESLQIFIVSSADEMTTTFVMIWLEYESDASM